MKNKGKVFLNSLILVSVLGILIWTAIEVFINSHIKDKKETHSILNFSYPRSSFIIEEQHPAIQTEVKKEYPKEEVIENYKGYKVEAKLEIPNISLITYILKENSKKALTVSPVKFYGPNGNEVGNFCIAGHNTVRKNMFHRLKELEIRDKFYLTDHIIGKVEYEIYDIYKVDPEDVSCLLQETNGLKEVTLITCTSDSKQRIIIKAREYDK